MPTLLPTREPQGRNLTLPQTVRFFVLLARLRWLDRQLEAAGRRIRTANDERAGDRLLATARRWLTIHARISALLGIPEPPHARAARIAMQPPPQRRSALQPDVLPVAALGVPSGEAKDAELRRS